MRGRNASAKSLIASLVCVTLLSSCVLSVGPPPIVADYASSLDLDALRIRDTRGELAAVPAEIQDGVFADPATYLPRLAAALAPAGQDPALSFKLIHDWIALNIWYDWPALLGPEESIQEPYGLLPGRKTTCGGYANLFVELSRLAGLEALYVDGRSKSYTYYSTGSLGSHAWNLVRINGAYLFVDVTFDSGNDFKDGLWQTEPLAFDYLFVAPEYLIYDHLPDEPAFQCLDRPLSRARFLSQPETVQGVSTVSSAFFDSGLSFPDGLPACLELSDLGGSFAIGGLSADGSDPLYVDAVTDYSDDSVFRTWTWFEKEGASATVTVRPAREGYSNIRLYSNVWDEIEDNEVLLAELLVRIDTPYAGTNPFPKQYSACFQYDFSLVSPLVGDLAPGAASFSFSCAEATQAKLSYYDSETQTFATGSVWILPSGSAFALPFDVNPPSSAYELLRLFVKTPTDETLSLCAWTLDQAGRSARGQRPAPDEPIAPARRVRQDPFRSRP